MGAKGITIAEECHVVNAIYPQAISGTGVTSDYWAMKEYNHASIIITKGAGSASTVTFYESQTSGGTVEATMAFDYYTETTALGDTLSARTAVTTAGFALSTNTGVFYVLEHDASYQTDTYPYCCVKLSVATSCYAAAVVILSGTRYAKEQTVTAIT